MTADQIARAGMLAADKARRRFGIEDSSWIDVYGAIETTDTILMFQPMRNLGGAYIAEPDATPGIIVNSNHPLGKQRLSAAHELGHFSLKHKTTLDVDLFGDGPRPPGHGDDEKLAEQFALWFLMPHRLLDASMKAMQIDEVRTPEEVYRLALHMGTSYEATSRHLVNAKRAKRPAMQAAQKIKPATIKRGLAGDFMPPDARNDVHLLNASENGTSRIVRPGDRILLTLSEMPTTGYVWHVDSNDALEMIGDVYLPAHGRAAGADEPDVTGGERQRRIVLAVKDVERPLNRTMLVAKNVRSWVPDTTLATFKAELAIEPTVRRGAAEQYFVREAA